MDWMKVRTNLHTDPRVAVIASRLGTSRATVVGALVVFWSLYDDHGVDGEDGVGLLRCIDEAAVDAVCELPGFAGALVAVGWASFSDEGCSLPRIDKHINRTARERAQNTARARHSRARRATTDGQERDDTSSPSRPDRDEGAAGRDSPDTGARQTSRQSVTPVAPERDVGATGALPRTRTRGEPPLTPPAGGASGSRHGGDGPDDRRRGDRHLARLVLDRHAPLVEDARLSYPVREGTGRARVAIADAAVVLARRIAGPRKPIDDTALCKALDALMRRAAGYAAHGKTVAMLGDPERRRFVPMPATWFRDGRYEDEGVAWEKALRKELVAFHVELGTRGLAADACALFRAKHPKGRDDPYRHMSDRALLAQAPVLSWLRANAALIAPAKGEAA